MGLHVLMRNIRHDHALRQPPKSTRPASYPKHTGEKQARHTCTRNISSTLTLQRIALGSTGLRHINKTIQNYTKQKSTFTSVLSPVLRPHTTTTFPRSTIEPRLDFASFMYHDLGIPSWRSRSPTYRRTCNHTEQIQAFRVSRIFLHHNGREGFCSCTLES